ncbi:Heat shock protein 70 [Desulfamplus magnetovallimortis]|uniref:Heat shock protein 70 n=1 Tax=Desulfamplus magnetovallimortis TaxID=1246637 RepID=A0A1W1H6L4_9BACT|nr:Hsp70 family protein [Desulfamplus magnetovallimortis]SLM28130.1 Heat shock protein 70 [Desulfamplus magnetovallimortis]
MSKSIGIDLGTTNSVAAIKRVHTEIIKNSEGDDLTPSCVTLKSKKGVMKYIAKESFVVGRHALEWMKQDPANTVTAVKRLMGRSINDPDVKKIIADRRHLNTITTHSRGTENSLAILLGKNEYTPEQISAKILEKIHTDSEKALGDTIEYAVITVPAYFNDKQKHATRNAAAIAGMKVQRLLPEPTAAAISFGVDSVGVDDAKTVLVFDFGGGTFDLSVLTISGGQFIEQGKGGNMWMGGEDIDQKIIDHVLHETAEEYDIDDIQAFIDGQSISDKNRFSAELKNAVEQAKIALSEKDETAIELLGILKDSDGDLIDIDVELTRNEFETIISPIVAGAMELVKNLLEQIHFTPDLIDNVLLVGGSSKIPCVIKAVKELFGEEKVLLHDRPMLAIAEGAAILSHRLSDSYECPGCGREVLQSDKTCPGCQFDLDAHVASHSVYDIIHSAAHDYYIVLENGEKYLLIEKNTPLPCEQKEMFNLVHHEQRLVHMKFVNVVNDIEESIGDLWLGIDDEMQESLYRKKYENENMKLNASDGDENGDSEKKETEEDVKSDEGVDPEKPLTIEVSLKIDENNIVEVGASIVEIPEAEISKNLSRGKADEKLFVELENLINETNTSDADDYVALEVTSRTIGIIKDINKVIDEKTGGVIEPVYDLAFQKIDNTRKLSQDGLTCQSLIYYCENVISSFGNILPPGDIVKLKKRTKHLEEMMERGSYKENVDAYNALDNALDKMPMVTALMTIKKAGGLCLEHEPAKAPLFLSAIQGLLSLDEGASEDRIQAGFDKIISTLPLAHNIIEKYDYQKTTIYKGITK